MAETPALDRNPDPTATSRVDDVLFATEDGVALHADLYLPRPIDGRRSPVIVWVHGGAWRFGDRRLAPDLSRFFAARGFAMASIDYRLSTQALFPAPVRDVKTAVRWLRSVAPFYGFDSDRIGLWGSSSGGHLAALAALSGPGVFEDASSPYSAYSSAVRAFVDGYGPTDFLQIDAHRPADGTPSDDPESILLPAGLRSSLPESPESLLLGAPIETCPERVRDANPIAYAKGGAPAALILHGACDTTVPVHQSVLLYDALAAHDNRVSLTIVDGLGHGFLNRSDLDDGPPRAQTTRTHVPGHGEQLVHESGQVFGLVEAFFREFLR
jgi:acetyl esterase/lipase